MLAALSRTDERYMDPMFITGVILAPVTKIVRILVEILTAHDLIKKVVTNNQVRKKNKIRIQRLLEHWYTMRYLKILVKSPTRHLPNLHDDLVKLEEKPYMDMVTECLGNTNEAVTVAMCGLLPLILVSLPKEFDRWKDCYGLAEMNIACKVEDGSVYHKPKNMSFARLEIYPPLIWNDFDCDPEEVEVDSLASSHDTPPDIELWYSDDISFDCESITEKDDNMEEEYVERCQEGWWLI